MSEPYADIAYEAAGPIRILTIDRPERMNAIGPVTSREMVDAIGNFKDDADARVLVITGRGEAAFCAGADLKAAMAGFAPDALPDEEPLIKWTDEEIEAHARGERDGIIGQSRWTDVYKPVIAAVNGVAAGAGASLAFACDLRIVADTAGFNLAFANVALSCDTGASYHLPLLVGRAKALELLYFPRTIKADEAVTLGLATKMVTADSLAAEVGALARRLADGPTVALGAMRQSVAYAAGHSFEETLAFESSMMQKTGATSDHSAAVSAFVAKEKPAFTGR